MVKDQDREVAANTKASSGLLQYVYCVLNNALFSSVWMWSNDQLRHFTKQVLLHYVL